MIDADAIVARCEKIYGDLAMSEVRRWKDAHPGKPAIGHLPVYVPREVIHACGALPVAVHGGGDQVDIVKGDACFQSYICHIPRSTVELGLQGDLDLLDGMIFPSTCDVIRNLTGIWQLLFPKKWVRYLDLPQNLNEATGGNFYRHDLELMAKEMQSLGALPLTPASLARSIGLFNQNRRAIEALYDLRSEKPWLVTFDECHLVVRAGSVLDVEEHTALVNDFVAAAKQRPRRAEDRIRVVVTGAFCEQPPLGLLRAIDRSGCYVVDDDLILGFRWIRGDIKPDGDALKAVAYAYLTQSVFGSTRSEGEESRADDLVAQVRHRKADGVVFAAPSFCDPSLLDQPPFQKALDAAKIPYITFKYAENTGQFQGIREQAGTFSDSIKLWGEA
jgi:benzoyl-CoA reductase subunit C